MGTVDSLRMAIWTFGGRKGWPWNHRDCSLNVIPLSPCEEWIWSVDDTIESVVYNCDLYSSGSLTLFISRIRSIILIIVSKTTVIIIKCIIVMGAVGSWRLLSQTFGGRKERPWCHRDCSLNVIPLSLWEELIWTMDDTIESVVYNYNLYSSGSLTLFISRIRSIILIIVSKTTVIILKCIIMVGPVGSWRLLSQTFDGRKGRPWYHNGGRITIIPLAVCVEWIWTVDDTI